MHSSSRLLRTRRASPSSRPWADLPPQALKRQLIPAVPSSGWQMKVGPESRHQLSSTGRGMKRTPSPHRARASACAAGSTTRFTGSKRAMALTTRAKSCWTWDRVTPQPFSHSALLCGQTIQVAACRHHSAGMNQPTALIPCSRISASLIRYY